MKRLVRSAFGLAAGILLGSGTYFGAAGAAVAPAGQTEPKNPAVAWESLPSIRTGVKIWAHTSKSALNCTIMDWTNYTLHDTNGYEQAFLQGYSGMLVQAWFAWLNAADGNLKLYLKDSKTPS